ncbi:DUF5626 family protein [Amedibacillus sp. YH-ame6]
MKKKFIKIIIAVFTIFANIGIISANDSLNDKEMEVKFNLSQDGLNTEIFVDKEGIPVTIKVEEIIGIPRSIENKTYKISTQRSGSWSASYYVTVYNYKFTSVSNATSIAYTGSFVSKNLVVNSSQMVTYYLKRKIGIVITNLYVRTEIVNKNLIVSVK